MSQAFHRFQMKMKTKMAILDQEMSESITGKVHVQKSWQKLYLRHLFSDKKICKIKLG